jgi:acetolactate synthase regulatory subunit
VHKLQFTSADPLDHVCRTLDTMRKMGFGLASLRVQQDADAAYKVSFDFDSRGSPSVATLVDRVAACVGVEAVKHDGAKVTD